MTSLERLPKVKNLESLLKGVLKPDEKVESCKVTSLTAPGENYGSIMLRILINVRNSKTGSERTLDTVGKILPASEITRSVFDSFVTFKSEYQYYASIVPILDKFLKTKGFEAGADFAAPFINGRLNLNDSNQVDDDAILLMENLKTQGYVTEKKTKGLNPESMKVALDALAKFHAAGIAFKFQHKDLFEKHFRPFCYPFIPEKRLYQAVYENLIPVLENSKFNKEEIEIVKTTYQKDQKKKNISDQWGTIIHYDTWTNNVMMKYDGTKPVHSILVDFQTFDYGTPLNDVMFFFFTSLVDFERHLDPLLNYYYDKLIQNLERLGSDAKLFSRSNFDAELKSAVKNYEYVHTIWMLQPILHEQMKSVDNFYDDDNSGALMNWSKQHVDKITAVTRVCFERGWL